jgi:hypothetical protein
MKKLSGAYIASIPERTVRSVVSAITGVTSLMTNLLLPSAIKESSTYRVTFGMLQQFLIEKVAEVEQQEKDYEVKDKYVVRKTAGSIIEGIGLLSIRFSPVWMLAILSDISGGSKVYLQRLIKDLKNNQLIDSETAYDNVYELLDGIKASTKIGVDAIDMPPITLEEFNEFKKSLVDSLKGNNESSKKMYKDLEQVYRKMNEVGKKEKISLAKLNGAMTLDLMKNTTKKGFDITRVTTRTSIDMINDTILKNYTDSLENLNRIGKRKYLIEHMSPFMKQFKNHYDSNHKTLTEKMIHHFK